VFGLPLRLRIIGISCDPFRFHRLYDWLIQIKIYGPGFIHPVSSSRRFLPQKKNRLPTLRVHPCRHYLETLCRTCHHKIRTDFMIFRPKNNICKERLLRSICPIVSTEGCTHSVFILYLVCARTAPVAPGSDEENSYEEMTICEIMTGKG